METKYNKDLKKGDTVYWCRLYSEDIWKCEITKVTIIDTVVVAKVKDLYYEMGSSYIVGFKDGIRMRCVKDDPFYHDIELAKRSIEDKKERRRLDSILWHKDALEKLGLKVTITT